MDSNCYIYDVDPCAGHCSLIEYSTMCPSYCTPKNDVSSKLKVNIQSGKMIEVLVDYFTYILPA